MSLQQYLTGLDPAIYRLDRSNNGEYTLSYVSMSYEIKEQVYGNITERRNRVMSKFLSSETGVAALLYGLKGSGKTTLSKLISNELVKLEYPVVIIDQEFKDAKFKTFMESLGNIGVIFDEFISVYGPKSQEDLLSFFDGMTKGKRLIMLTTNDIGAVVSQMKNRPGRVYYTMKFLGITRDEAKLALSNTNLHEDIVNFILYIISSRDDISWDILNKLIEEAYLSEDTLDLIDRLTDVNIDIMELNEITFVPHGNIELRSDERMYLTDTTLNLGSNKYFKYYNKENKQEGKRYYSNDEPYYKYNLGMDENDVMEVNIFKINIYDMYKENRDINIKTFNTDMRRSRGGF